MGHKTRIIKQLKEKLLLKKSVSINHRQQNIVSHKKNRKNRL